MDGGTSEVQADWSFRHSQGERECSGVYIVSGGTVQVVSHDELPGYVGTSGQALGYRHIPSGFHHPVIVYSPSMDVLPPSAVPESLMPLLNPPSSPPPLRYRQYSPFSILSLSSPSVDTIIASHPRYPVIQPSISECIYFATPQRHLLLLLRIPENSGIPSPFTRVVLRFMEESGKGKRDLSL